MRVRLEAKIRCAALLEARESSGLRVAEVCKLARVGMRDYYAITQLDFSIAKAREKVDRLACVLGVAPDEIMPVELEGAKIANARSEDRDMEPVQLLSIPSSAASANLLAESPLDSLERAELSEEVRRVINRDLSVRERRALSASMDGQQLRQIGKSLGVSVERARQIIKGAHEKIRHTFSSSERCRIPFMEDGDG